MFVLGVKSLSVVDTGGGVEATTGGDEISVGVSVDGGGVEVEGDALPAPAITWSRSLSASRYFDSSVRIFALSYLVAGFSPFNSSIALLYSTSASLY